MNTNNKNQRGKRSRPRRNRRRARDNDENRGIVVSRIPRVLLRSSPFPPFMHCWLTYTGNYIIQGASTYFVYDFALNSLYQFDVTGGATHSFSGENQLATIYESYHCTDVEVRLQVQTNETVQGATVGFIFRDALPSTSITSFAKAMNALEVTPAIEPMMVVPLAGNPGMRTRVYRCPIGAIVGNPLSYAADTSYTTAFGNFNPTQLVFGALIVCGNGTGNLTSGVTVTATFRLKVRAYSIRPLLE